MKKSISGAHSALLLLLGINLFNYIDRQILAALEPDIRATFFAAGDVNAMTKTGLLGVAFFVTYMISAPILGLLADRISRWIIVGVCSDFVEPGQRRLWFGRDIRHSLCDSHFRWNWRRRLRPGCANDLVRSFPDRKTRSHYGDFLHRHSGWQRARLRHRRISWCSSRLALGILSRHAAGFAAGSAVFLAARSARRCTSPGARIAATQPGELREAFRTRSYLINCIAQTLMTFVTGGLGFWASAYLRYRDQSPDVGMTIFGLITVVAGLVSTLLGGIIADKLRSRFPGSYFWVSGIGMLIACPFFIATLYIPFPAAWITMFVAIFFLFLNTGPSNTALANVSLPLVRATAFAVNIFVIHALGDVQAFWLLGYIGGHTNMHVAFLFVSGMIFASGVAWLIGSQNIFPQTRLQ